MNHCHPMYTQSTNRLVFFHSQNVEAYDLALTSTEKYYNFCDAISAPNGHGMHGMRWSQEWPSKTAHVSACSGNCCLVFNCGAHLIYELAIGRCAVPYDTMRYILYVELNS